MQSEQEIPNSDIDEKILQERKRDLLQIESDVGDVSEIMTELSKLTNDQGNDLDEASEHMSDAVESMRTATDQLEKAEYYSQRIRNVGVACMAVAAGVVTFVGVYAIVRNKPSNRG
jgi:t-SNARE complex subunit (syntaxin)